MWEGVFQYILGWVVLVRGAEFVHYEKIRIYVIVVLPGSDGEYCDSILPACRLSGTRRFGLCITSIADNSVGKN